MAQVEWSAKAQLKSEPCRALVMPFLKNQKNYLIGTISSHCASGKMMPSGQVCDKSF